LLALRWLVALSLASCAASCATEQGAVKTFVSTGARVGDELIDPQWRYRRVRKEYLAAKAIKRGKGRRGRASLLQHSRGAAS
jgi:hypothetical protein